ncbi:CsiV family protein [Pseudomonas sp. JDS28PS106]|uniref:CsiV family protein n=1 Tax=Pseudomonas sp. JDS28PS106 TaxID=2497235 RepID=UPI002FD65A13
MRLFRSLMLLLTLVAPAAFADGSYQVEMILFRQNGEPPATRQFAPEDWDAGAPRVGPENERSPTMNDVASRLQDSGDYQVLLQRAWRQTLGEQPSAMAVTGGEERLGHFPIEGTISIALARFTDIAADFWVNQLDAHGVLAGSERMKQTVRVRNGELTYLDNGSLALLVRISPL